MWSCAVAACAVHTIPPFHPNRFDFRDLSTVVILMHDRGSFF